MILWQSLHVEVNCANPSQAIASGDDDQHQLLPFGQKVVSPLVVKGSDRADPLSDKP